MLKFFFASVFFFRCYMYDYYGYFTITNCKFFCNHEQNFLKKKKNGGRARIHIREIKENFSVIVKTNIRKKDFWLVRKLIGRQISTNEGSLSRLNLGSLFSRTIFFLVSISFHTFRVFSYWAIKNNSYKFCCR